MFPGGARFWEILRGAFRAGNQAGSGKDGYMKYIDL